MTYNTFEAFKRNLFTKTKKERERTQKINKLEKQLKNNKKKFTYGKKVFKNRESAQAYLDKIKSNRNVNAFQKFNELQAKHELQRLDRAIKKGSKIGFFESTLKLKFPKGILGEKSFYKKDVKVTYTQLLEQLRRNYYGDIGAAIIALGQAVNNETLKNQGSIVYSLTKLGLLSIDDYNKIYDLYYSVSSRERYQDWFIFKMITLLDTILKTYIDGGY